MAIVIDTSKVEAQLVSDSGASKLLFKQIFTSKHGGRLHCNIGKTMPGGYSREHKHEWDQINFVLSGKGILKINNEEVPIEKGMAIYIPGNELHLYKNVGSEPLEILGVLGPMAKD